MENSWINKAPLVNIILSSYNGEKYITEQLDSIRNQTYQKFHIWIRDDGSVDQTAEIISHYIKEKKEEKRMTFIKESNIGFCPSFFKLLRMASDGDYWAFCDQDDVWFPEKLENAIRWFQTENENIPLLYHSGIQIGNHDLSEVSDYSVATFDYKFPNCLTSNIYFGFAMVINRTLYQSLVLADEKKIKYHDWFAAMIASTFGKCHMSSKLEAIHRMHENNTSPLYFWKKIPDGIRLLKGDLFYTENAREFERIFHKSLNCEQQKILDLFLNQGYSLKNSLKKAFYHHRWNPKIEVEIVQRCLMMIGKI